MTAAVFGERAPDGELDPLSVEHVAPLVAYLASPAAERINGQVFVAYGGMIALMAPPTVEQRFDLDATDRTWTLADLDAAIGGYFADREPGRTFACADVLSLS
jgi:3-oxoacyl-[acyl-carrier protein] reductase